MGLLADIFYLPGPKPHSGCFQRLSFHRVISAGMLFHNYSGSKTCKPLLASGGISYHWGTML
jgi:hypothetical protein